MTMSKIATGAACLLAFLVAWTARAAVVDQSQENANSNLFIGAIDQRIFQTFTPAIEGELTDVRLRIGYLPSTGGDASNLLLELMTTTASGAPSGSVLATVSLAHGAFPIAGGILESSFTDFVFGGVPLHAGTRYALALRVASPQAVCVSAMSACTEPAYRANYLFATDAYTRGQLFEGTG